jgi:cephalosporin hydroxylase
MNKPQNFSFRNIFGFCDFHDLYQSIADQLEDGDQVVEVGVMYGHSVAFLSEYLKSIDKKVTIYAVDMWDDIGVPEFNKENDKILTGIFGSDYINAYKKDPNIFYKHFLTNMFNSNNLTNVIPLKLPSVEASNLIDDKSLKFCFIDANHTYEFVKQDIEHWRKKIIPGCILAGHDYGWEGVKQAVDEAFPNVNVIGSSWWVTIE